MIERYPVSVYKNFATSTENKVKLLKQEAGISVPLKKWNIFRAFEKFIDNYWILKIITDYQNMYNVAYVFLAASAFINPLFYSVLVVDIVKRSEDLKNILR